MIRQFTGAARAHFRGTGFHSLYIAQSAAAMHPGDSPCPWRSARAHCAEASTWCSSSLLYVARQLVLRRGALCAKQPGSLAHSRRALPGAAGGGRCRLSCQLRLLPDIDGTCSTRSALTAAVTQGPPTFCS